MYTEFLISFIIYLILILVIGIIATHKRAKSTQKNSSSSNFILGGRSTHWFLTALSAHAADMSDWLFMALPAAIYTHGIFDAWISIGLLTGMLGSWHFIAARLRTETEKYHAYTLASFFQNKYKDTTGIIIALVALISCFFFVIYLSVGLKGIGYVLESVFSINYHVGICIALCIVLAYTLIGGFTAVAWIDLFQGLFLLSMLMMVPLYALWNTTSIQAIGNALIQKKLTFSLIPDFSFSSFAAILLNPFSWGLGYFGMPHILTKFMGSENAHDMHKAKYVGIAWQMLAMSSAILVGLVGITFFPYSVPGRTEFIFIEMTKALFIPWLAGPILCAVLAATISTIDSQLLVLAGIIAHDFYKNVINKQASTQEILFVYRIALIASGILGICIAWNEESTIMNLVRYAWSGLGASFAPLTILSLYSERINKYGAIGGIFTGCAVSVLWNIYNPLIYNIEVYSIVPAFVAGIITIYGISLITKQ